MGGQTHTQTDLNWIVRYREWAGLLQSSKPINTHSAQLQESTVTTYVFHDFESVFLEDHKHNNQTHSL